DDLKGNSIYRARNVHAGNLVRVTFYNNARLGNVSGDQSLVYAGEWPIGTGMVQMGNSSAYVMTELRVYAGLDSVTGDSTYEVISPVVFCEGWDPNLFSHDSLGMFLGFEPLPGYLNITQKEKDPFHAVAMSHQAFTWPPFWPDKMEDVVDPGWSAHWNGYFGKDQKNADEESYFVLDDNPFTKKLKGHSLPTPIASDPSRGGLGLRLSVRGLQWANPDAQDCIFWLYKIKNFSELKLDKTLFGANVGASSGALVSLNTDWDDDDAKFFREISLAVNFDNDNIGTQGYSPVPWVGFAFLESPGNPFDGIDNDGDGNDSEKPGGGTGKIINELDDFYKFYAVGDPIILIDYESEYFDRTISSMPAQGITINHNGTTYQKNPNSPLEEIPRNGFDDNLNGLIDESDGAETQDGEQFFLYIKSEFNDQDYLSIDYFNGDGMQNQLIDERRDDQIDNDNDWDSQFDDVGLDGKPGTGDEGEGDGVPTPGSGDLPGEPNIDRVDVDESDQIGLTSFKFYRYGTLTYSNDDQMWDFSRPGYFDKSTTERADHDYVFSSGYFPLRPQAEEFFSISTVYGVNEEDILRNKTTVQKIYNSNYNFAVAPDKPKVKAVAGNNKIILYWEDNAEQSFDRFLKQYDFEGYKIYKASHHTFGDAGSITDGLGFDRFKKPIEIYDKVNEIFGFFPNDFGTGVLFNLGNETGLVHTYVDEDVTNGITYYYAVTAYDRGDFENNIGPSETTIFVNISQTGEIQLSENVVTVTPQAPSLGYQEAGFDVMPKRVGAGKTSGIVGVNIIDPDLIQDGDEYEIQFIDNSVDNIDNDFDGKIDNDDGSELIPNQTTGFILTNLTQSFEYDTVNLHQYVSEGDSSFLLTNLYDDKDGDPNTFSQILDGMEIYVYNPPAGVIDAPEDNIYDGISWSNSINYFTAYNMLFDRFKQIGFVEGTAYPRQYELIFFDELVDTSEALGVPLASTGTLIPLPPRQVNFKAFDPQTGEELKFGFIDNTPINQPLSPPAGFFSAKDRIIFFETLANDSVVITHSILNNEVQDTVFYNNYERFLGAGDTLRLYPDLPFNNETKYRFTFKGQSVDNRVAKNNLDDIKVVPNPYVVTALWEPHNPYTSGRGPRQLQFINLPAKCTIRIYAVDGTLVQTLYHDTNIRNGAESWDLMTKDNMDVAYGIYIYHV
ncbi:MAG: hypothetical protein GY808_14695, partial [Gammaproteobacteria bacterium]|nr:hypothetical protein [Gammaproteobacteria bacterium]